MTTTLIARPETSEYAPFFHGYVTHVPDGDVLAVLRSSGQELIELLGRIPEERGGHRYAPDKWTIREVVGHMSDTERILTYRALRIGRGDQTPLPAFDENLYVANAGSDARPMADLVSELRTVREATALLFESFPADAWERRGVMSGNGVSLRALVYIVTGHALHHLRILRERYGVS